MAIYMLVINITWKMVLFIFCKCSKDAQNMFFVSLEKRVPNWSLMTKGNWSTVKVIRWPLSLLENQLTVHISALLLWLLLTKTFVW